MEQRRVLLFFVLSMAVLFVWMNFVAPVFFPPPPRPAVPDEVAADKDDPDGANPGDVVGADPAAPVTAPKPGDPPVEPDKPAQEPEDVAVEPEPEVPARSLTLGSMDPAHGYFLSVEVTNRGAGIESVTLNDPRFPEVDDPKKQLEILQKVDGIPAPLTTVFAPTETDLNDYLKPALISNWAVATKDDEELLVYDEKHPEVLRAVTFRKSFPELGIEVDKTFRLTPAEVTDEALREARKTFAKGYEIQLEFTVRNLTRKPKQFRYLLQGPTGLPLEDRRNARLFRTIKIGYPDESGAVELETLTAAALKDAVAADEVKQYGPGYRFAGIDVQYFTALIVPNRDQKADPTIASTRPMVLTEEADKNFIDVSLLVQSREFTLLGIGEQLPDGAKGDEVSEAFSLYVGPKREDLLAAYDARGLLDYGTFGALAGLMLIVLNFLHNLGLTYGIAIIALTILVRLCMFPLTKKQSLGAQKMKELQPKLAEIKRKYAKDKEKLARAQMELFRKHNYNPLAGCLPMLLQLPIFISLYTALSTSVDLRMTPFLWFDNLAAPDALFNLGFDFPFLGNQFNLLPIFTIVLFIVQQRMFMPPATDPEQAAQYKMMNIMMIFMGFLFYKVPAGLCIYFIASSLWGIGERKLLDRWKDRAAQANPQTA